MRKDRKRRLRRLAERLLERQRNKSGVEIIGTIKMTHSGYGFVVPEHNPGEEVEDIFIPTKFVGGALDGDRVRVAVMPPRKGHPEDRAKGPVGKILETLSRERTEVVGELLAGSFIRPLNPRLPDEIAIHGSRHGAQRGDWVRIKLEEENGRWRGVVREVLGRAGVLSADLDAVMAEYELMPRYTEAEELAAQQIEPRQIDRVDLNKDFVITVDPFDAKDFDDALSISPGAEAGTVDVGIHIADVAAYIAPKSKFDEAAYARGFSCYLPGRTLPMLPAGLTARISMQENCESLAHTVVLTVDKKSGEVLAGKRFHSLVTVKKRLSYDEVQNFIDSGEVPSEWGSKVAKTVKDIVSITRKMRDYRDKVERFIDLPLPEVRVICDEKENKIVGLQSRISREAEFLVEECMLAANQFVGRELLAKNIAGIYRIHAEVTPEKSMEFSDLMADAFRLHPGDISNRDVCREFIASIPDDERRNVILSLLLRAMPRAIYSGKNDIHFALGKSAYCHFTSPIRRYADLIVHQQLWNSDSRIRTRNGATLERVAVWCSEQEEHIDGACFAAGDRMKLRYLEEVLAKDASKIYEGVIIRVLSSGLQVDIGELGLYGFVRKERLRGSYRRSHYNMNDDRDSTIYRPGNYIYLRLDSIDFARGVANFLPAGR